MQGVLHSTYLRQLQTAFKTFKVYLQQCSTDLKIVKTIKKMTAATKLSELLSELHLREKALAFLQWKGLSIRARQIDLAACVIERILRNQDLYLYFEKLKIYCSEQALTSVLPAKNKYHRALLPPKNSTKLTLEPINMEGQI